MLSLRTRVTIGTIGFILTIVATARLVVFYEWNRKSFHKLADHPVKSFALLVCFFALLAAIVWAFHDPDGESKKVRFMKKLTIVVLTLAVVGLGAPILEGITWSTILWISVGVVGIVLLWYVTVVQVLPANLMNRLPRINFRRPAPVSVTGS